MVVTFIDNSIQIMTELNDTTIAKLYEAANAIASHAQRNCTMRSEDDGRLAGSYRADVYEDEGLAQIGTPMEEGLWEEFGTGSHADTKKNGGKPGRSGWWIYTPDSEGPEGYKSNVYATRSEAEEMAAYIRKIYKHEAVVTNGRDPNYTLEKAFTANTAKIVQLFENGLKETFGT